MPGSAITPAADMALMTGTIPVDGLQSGLDWTYQRIPTAWRR